MIASINVEEGALELMSKGNLDEPVIMLNLLKYLDKAKFGFGVDGLSGKEAYQVYGKKVNESFIEDFKKLGIEKDQEILTMCMGGVRSQAASELLTKENYNCSNISDGFLGNSLSPGWKKSGLPCK